jgi:two-component system cell cycle response regulator
MNFEVLKEIYKTFVVIDKNGNIVLSFAKEPFKDLKIKNVDELNDWFSKHYKNYIPIFGNIIVNNNKYWIERKKIKDYIVYIIEELKYVDLLLDEIEKKAIIDSLTGAYNKREILEQLKRHLMIYLRYLKNSFSIIMFDIDFFKKVNDTYGHLAGDFVLKELSVLTKSLIRESDIFGRFGGEEFIIILPETKIVGAMKLAERLTETIEKHDFMFDNEKIPVTISLGVTSVTRTDSVESLLDRCDVALYEAKKNGRNRVEYR